MNINIGSGDATVRAIIGIALIAAAVFGVVGLWSFAGIVLVVTALRRQCPVYRYFGKTTCAAS